MPTYNFYDNSTNLEFEKFMSISSKAQYLLDNPHIETRPGSPAICDSVRIGVRKKDAGFTEVLQKIHERSAGSVMNRNNSW